MHCVAGKLYRFALMTLSLACVVGCAHWKDVDLSNGFDVADAALPQDARHRLVVEVSFVNLPLETLDSDQIKGLWQWVDETHFDSELRQRLLNNGIRIGMVSNAERFHSKIDSFSSQGDVVDQFLSEAAVASDVSHGDQRIPMRLGRRYELALRQPFDGSHVALIRNDGETIGRTLNNAQYFLTMTASQADKAEQVRLQVLPEIQYGAARQKWISSDTAIRIDTRRETWSLDMFQIDLTVSSGDTIVLAPDHPVRGLASKMLTGNGTDQDHQQLLVLIHIRQVPSPADKLR